MPIGPEWIHLGICYWARTFLQRPLVWKKMIISKILVMQNTKMYMNEFIWGHTTGTEPSSNAPPVGKIWILARVRKQSYKGHPQKNYEKHSSNCILVQLFKHYDALFNRKKSTWNQRIMVLKVQGCLRKNNLNFTSCSWGQLLRRMPFNHGEWMCYLNCLPTSYMCIWNFMWLSHILLRSSKLNVMEVSKRV